MLGSQTLDVAVGLIFVYLLLSLVVTATNELIAAWLKRRASTLWKGIVQLVGNEGFAQKIYAHPLVAGLTGKPWLPGLRADLPFKKRPSYIPSEGFTLAMLDTLVPATGVAKVEIAEIRAALAKEIVAGGPNAALARSLVVLLDDAENDLKKFKVNIQKWFDASMDRVSGWYKRRTQWILVGLALLVTVWMNADTVAIVNTLWRDPAVRTALVTQAGQFSAKQAEKTEAPDQEKAKEKDKERKTAASDASPTPAASAATGESVSRPAEARDFNKSLQDLRSLAIPIGWKDAFTAAGGGAAKQPDAAEDRREAFPKSCSAWSEAIDKHLLGWLLTMLAISLGSPFWFDMLNKVISIRSAGKNPQETDKAKKQTATA